MGLRMLLAAVLAAATAVAGCPCPVFSQPTPSTAQREYTLGPGDTVEVQVVGRQDFTTRVKVDAEGAIQVPYLGAVHAAGETAKDLGDALAKALVGGGYFSNPVMRVDIVGYASQYVTVLGAVMTPGLVPIDRPYRVSEIIARVGGTRDTAADYVIVRSQTGEERRFLIKDLMTGGAAEDPLVWPGDKIFSPAADQFYVQGEVQRPGGYPMTSGMTVREAIARGGGLTYRGTDRAVSITRSGVRLRAVQLDSKIEAGDVIVVGERFF
ncbi:MAG: SLBB domain-containing protein [Caulobacteraceae bacterium]|nr:SLBB domain-containing protein [Caulobacteraceae bacterium]